MRDHDDVDPAASHPTRRSVLQAGLLALGATQLPDVFATHFPLPTPLHKKVPT